MAYRIYPETPTFDRIVAEIGLDGLLEKHCDDQWEPLPDCPPELKRELDDIRSVGNEEASI